MSGSVTPTEITTKGQRISVVSPPPVYIHTPPPATKQMITSSPTNTISMENPGEGSISGGSSTTAVDQIPGQRDDLAKPLNQTYQDWYPGDASHEGKPAWWNKLFCCGYGLGCLLCPCGSCNCK
ncbi:hypothetical protein M231_02335 [Tremella mesenterica]|uniref:Uncharacterized protein n=1 Tax=Tremella mesenterica TaxID=5217 RepID=A0A4Q1BR69_TREME|nr:hypothetical protein M231_02335 [Tremella mesenterica]